MNTYNGVEAACAKAFRNAGKVTSSAGSPRGILRPTQDPITTPTTESATAAPTVTPATPSKAKVEITAFNPVESGVGTKNLLLLLK